MLERIVALSALYFILNDVQDSVKVCKYRSV